MCFLDISCYQKWFKTFQFSEIPYIIESNFYHIDQIHIASSKIVLSPETWAMFYNIRHWQQFTCRCEQARIAYDQN